MSTFWLSYADADFRGAIIIEDIDFLSACGKAKANGISPGGQVQGVRIEDDMAIKIPSNFRNRLLSKYDVVALTNLMEPQ